MPVKKIKKINRKITEMFKKFASMQAASGIILFAAAILAIIFVNSNFGEFYHQVLSFSLPINLPILSIHKEMDLKLWIDDGLMAVFFLLVGLELKRELLVGELSSRSQMVLPFFTAIAGVAVPMVIYGIINYGNSENMRGLAIPAATDIAFAFGILSLFGDKVPHSLKVFLVALAIIDDLVAILIIAFFYSSHIDPTYLSYAAVATLALISLNRFKIFSLTPYLVIAPFLWIFVLKSGVHATIAGVILAFTIPLVVSKNNVSPLRTLEKFLHAPVGYLILPIFAFANSGILLSAFSFENFSSKIVLGIIFGLFFGKQIGIAITAFILQKFKFCKPFKDFGWLEFYGVSIIAGVGFTMSLFIGNLAFSSPEVIDQVKVGVVSGSLLSGIFGFMVIKIAIARRKSNKSE
ncbi:MAG: NhaA family Na+:H+ antiporter [Rickettsiales bacterium]|jgi:NhaA family Na+:H+ antiporter